MPSTRKWRWVATAATTLLAAWTLVACTSSNQDAGNDGRVIDAAAAGDQQLASDGRAIDGATDGLEGRHDGTARDAARDQRAVSDGSRRDAAHSPDGLRPLDGSSATDMQGDLSPDACQASCLGKSCGAQDGCGGICQTGSCAAQEVCQAGSCVCQFTSCYGTCCASGESCVSGACALISACSASSANTVATTTTNYAIPAAIAVDNNDVIHLAYYDVPNKVLRYATRSATGSFSTIDVTTDAISTGPLALTIDANGVAHLINMTPKGQLAYHRQGPSGFTQEIVDSATDVRDEMSIAVAGADVHVAYFSAGQGDLKYARRKSGSWSSETVDAQGSVGRYNSIGIDTQGVVHISYYDSTTKVLRYAVGSAGAFKTLAPGVTTGAHGDYTSLAIDDQGRVHIAYRHAGMLRLEYARQAFAGSTAWFRSTVDGATDVGEYARMVLDRFGRSHFIYRDKANKKMKYAVGDYNPVKGLTTFTLKTISDAEGLYCTLALDSAGHAQAGSYTFKNSGELLYHALCP